MKSTGVARRTGLWETTGMAKPSLLIGQRLENIITQGQCPICRATFVHGGQVGEDSKRIRCQICTRTISRKSTPTFCARTPANPPPGSSEKLPKTSSSDDHPQSPLKLKLFFTRVIELLREKYLHAKFADKQIKNEWFSLNEEDLQSCQTLIKDSRLVLQFLHPLPQLLLLIEARFLCYWCAPELRLLRLLRQYRLV